MQLLPMASSPDGLISARYAVITKTPGWGVLTTTSNVNITQGQGCYLTNVGAGGGRGTFGEPGEVFLEPQIKPIKNKSTQPPPKRRTKRGGVDRPSITVLLCLRHTCC